MECPLEPRDPVALLVLAVILGCVLGFALALALGNRRADREREGDGVERSPGAPEVEVGSHGEQEPAVVFRLPGLLRQMFAVSGRRGAAPLALNLAEQLLQPEQCAIFMARPAQRRLALADGRGLPPSLPPGFEIEYGHGRVGHVAEARRVMDEADFRSVSELLKAQLAATETRDLRADLVAPIEHEGGLVGVISVGGVRAGGGQPKPLLALVAEVTAIALVQNTRLRAIEEAANVDGLTAVYNKRYFQKRLEDEMRKAEGEEAPLSLLILDIDHFKNYNDANGHLDGDEVLKKVGQLLRGSIREDDVAARYGGEEFVILYVGASKDLALRLAEGLRRAVESFPFPHRERQPLGAVSISGGVATFPDDVRGTVDLIRAADEALYEAKAAGRNRIFAARSSRLT